MLEIASQVPAALRPIAFSAICAALGCSAVTLRRRLKRLEISTIKCGRESGLLPVDYGRLVADSRRVPQAQAAQ